MALACVCACVCHIFSIYTPLKHALRVEEKTAPPTSRVMPGKRERTEVVLGAGHQRPRQKESQGSSENDRPTSSGRCHGITQQKQCHLCEALLSKGKRRRKNVPFFSGPTKNDTLALWKCSINTILFHCATLGAKF